MPQLAPWRNRKDSQTPTGGLLDPSTHPDSHGTGDSQAVNGANVYKLLRDGALQADTVVRSAANVLTFGGANNAEAAWDAFEHGGAQGWRPRYDAMLAQQKARDAYDTGHRRAAQVIGDLAGVGLSLYDPPLKGVGAIRMAKATRLPGAVGLMARDRAAILAAGAGTGVVGQTTADLTTGQPSSWQNDVGAGIGGAAQAGTLFLGPKFSSAIGGAATSASQDFLNHRSISLEHAGETAAAGGLLGRVAGDYAETWSGNLSPKAKGDLGQALGEIRSTATGRRRYWGPKKRDPIQDTRKYWYPDGRRGDLRFEDKFGPAATLSNNQKLAQAKLGDNFWLNHFLPEDVGKAASVPAGAAAPIVTDQSSDR